jgi:hypothetical protein
MSGAETVKGSTPVALSLGVVGGCEVAGATDFGGAVVGVVDDVGSTTSLLSLEDEGACVELGIAYGQKHLLQSDKLLIGLQTDIRAAFLGAKLNAMIHGSFDYITDNENNLFAALGNWWGVSSSN